MNSIFFVKTMLPLPSSQVSVAVWSGRTASFRACNSSAATRLFVGLDDRDFVEKPIGSGLIGEEFGAIGEKDVAVDPVPIPVFGTGELIEIGLGKLRLLGHAKCGLFRFE